MTLYELLHHSGVSQGALLWTGRGDTEGVISKSKACHVTGLWCDSRMVQKGGLFAVFDGTHHQGETFVKDALACGACILLVSQRRKDKIIERYAPLSSFFLVWDDVPRRCFALMVASWFSHRQPPHMAAVTGTNGKTSVASFTRQLWACGGMHGASLGTLGVQTKEDARVPATRPATMSHHQPSLTTLDSYRLHESLAWLDGIGMSHAIMEASSHGLAQYRLDGVRIDVAACTNIGRDHLDYHVTMEAYQRAKARLFFEIVEDDGCCVFNLDDDVNALWHDTLTRQGMRLMSYGRAHGSTLRLLKIDGNGCVVTYDGRDYRLAIPFRAEFHVMNVLCACAIVLASSSMGCEELFAAVRHVRSVAGRLQRVARASDGCGGIYIDYAHTTDALRAVLSALSVGKARHASLWVVFGCGGERDKGKRIEMGRCADMLADKSIITDDNPRLEDASSIRRDIMGGFARAPMEIPSREQAIAHAMDGAGCDDIILIAGKGHEDYQMIGRESLPFSDEACVHSCCALSPRWEAVA